MIANTNAAIIGTGDYPDYPILAVQGVQPASQAAGLDFYLEDYSPKTLNAAVSTSQNQGTNSTKANSVQHTTGSSSSNTNTYDVSVSAGFFGLDPTASVTAGYSTSSANTFEQSVGRGSSNERGMEAGSASLMSIKDWASYAFVDPVKQQLSWVWGQEYPWNVIAFNQVAPETDGQINLPPYVQALLFDGSILYPPSEISQFGFNFVAHARWVFYVTGEARPVDEKVSFTHTLSYWEGAHGVNTSVDPPVVAAILQNIATNVTIEALTLNLPVLSLRPVSEAGPGNGALVGFVVTEFITPPGRGPFRLKSSANNLYVTNGTGFDPLTDADAVLTASSISSKTPASFTVQFKIADPDIELSLHLRHWKIGAGSCSVAFAVNGRPPIVRHVDAMNAASGADNLTTITLRLRDYTNPDFYDYLVMGLNMIVVTVSPGDGAASCGYALRALAIQ